MNKSPFSTIFIGSFAGLLLLGLLFSTSLPVRAATFISADKTVSSLTVKDSIAHDGFIAGQFISITAPVGGELFAAGNSVSISTTPGRSLIAAGNTVTVEQGATYNAYVAGGTVTLAGQFGNDVYVAGSSVIIKNGTVIKGDLHVTGGQVVLAGTVQGSVWASGGTIESSLITGGNFNSNNSTLRFTGGSIGGDLNYTASRDATGLDTAKIAGKIQRTDRPTQEVPAERAAFSWFLFLSSLITLFVVSGLLFAFQPTAAGKLRDSFMSHWISALGIGFVFLVAGPLLMAIFLLTFVGWKLALLVGVFYVLLIIVGSAIGAAALGRVIVHHMLPERPAGIVDLLLGALVIAFFTNLPTVGGVLGVLVFIFLTTPSIGLLIMRSREAVAVNEE